VTATATESPTTRRCPRCDAPMAPEQDWCLECGDEVTTKIAKPPGWRVPVAIVLGTLVIAGAAIYLVISSLDDDADKAAGGSTAATTPAPTRTAAASAPVRRRATARRSPAAGATTKAVPLWPPTRKAYTVVVAAPDVHSVAEARARTLIRFGRDAGILRSDDYQSFGPGAWVVWRGKYPTRAAAEKSLPEVKKAFPSAYAAFIRRKS
jgi:hypothetical protein